MSTEHYNDFPVRQSSMKVYSDPSAIAAAESVKARIQSAYIMAIQQPRSEKQARDRILTACRRSEFASRAEYSKPVGKDKISGPSIRFAELALREWGNIISEVQVLYEDENLRRVRVSILDLETNAQFSKDISIKKTVERKSKKGREQDVISERKNSYGETVYILTSTDEELYTKESAWVSKIIRNEGLRLIPTDIIEEGLQTARATILNRDKQDPEGEKKKILDAFSSIGVKPVDLEKHLLKGQSIDSISPSQLSKLRTVYTSIKEGTPWTDFISDDDSEPKNNPVDTSKYDNLIKTKQVDHVLLGKFEQVTAKANNSTVDELKVVAAESFDKFMASFENWVKKNEPEKKADIPTLPQETIEKIKQAFELDPVAAKQALIECGTDSTTNMNETQAKKFLSEFNTMLDKGVDTIK